MRLQLRFARFLIVTATRLCVKGRGYVCYVSVTGRSIRTSTSLWPRCIWSSWGKVPILLLPHSFEIRTSVAGPKHWRLSTMNDAGNAISPR